MERGSACRQERLHLETSVSPCRNLSALHSDLHLCGQTPQGFGLPAPRRVCRQQPFKSTHVSIHRSADALGEHILSRKRPVSSRASIYIDGL